MQPRKYFTLGGAVLIIALPLVLSCYPGDQLTSSDTDVVVTLFDEKADFATKFTYAMPDTVVHLVADGQKDTISRKYDSTILNTIVSNMDDLGYTRVTDPTTADVTVITALTVQNYTGYVSYDWYWDYWYGYPPGWGWYPWYPSGGATYSYSVGTLFVVMMDPDKTDGTGNHVPPIWSAGLNGLASSSSSANRIVGGINQAFDQSQYLGAGK